MLRNDDDARAFLVTNELREMAGHCLLVVRYQDSSFRGRNGQHIEIRAAREVRRVRSLKVDRRLAAQKRKYDDEIKVRVRLEPYWHNLARLDLPARLGQLQVESWVGVTCGLPLIFKIGPRERQILIDLSSVSEVKGNGAVNRFKRNRGKRLSDRLSRLTLLKGVDD